MTKAAHNGGGRRLRAVWTSLVGQRDRRAVRRGGRGPVPLYEALAIGLGCDVVGQPASRLTAREVPQDRPV